MGCMVLIGLVTAMLADAFPSRPIYRQAAGQMLVHSQPASARHAPILGSAYGSARHAPIPILAIMSYKQLLPVNKISLVTETTAPAVQRRDKMAKP